jgi:hypothetical protein
MGIAFHIENVSLPAKIAHRVGAEFSGQVSMGRTYARRILTVSKAHP